MDRQCVRRRSVNYKIIKRPKKGILVAVTIDYEKRAKVFRDVHTLALQVIRDTRVLNGILVVRSKMVVLIFKIAH
jgi:hypothetical protein